MITNKADADRLKADVRGQLANGATISFRYNRTKKVFAIYASGRKVHGIGTFPDVNAALGWLKTLGINQATHNIADVQARTPNP
jgi:hypothetical protein